jgi:coproporphyrinogen III oxidase-like Fe-S oxidoreductase
VLDPTFNANKERARRLLALIEEKACDIHWHFEVRAESLDRDLARRFAELGASLQIGLQTARPEVAAKIGRPLDRGLFASKIGLLNEEGAVFGLDLIYGLPGDDPDGFRSSLDFALSLYPNNRIFSDSPCSRNRDGRRRDGSRPRRGWGSSLPGPVDADLQRG